MKNLVRKIFLNNSIWGYLIELVIVILGVTVAFYLNTLAETKKENKLKASYFQALHSDISEDIKRLDHAIKFNKWKVGKLENGLSFYSNSEIYKDSILQYALLIGNYDFFNPHDITYKTMITSGDFKLVDDPEIKKDLVRLYNLFEQIDNLQTNFLEALDQNYFPFLVERVDYIEGRTIDPDFHKEVKVKNYMVYTLNDISTHISYYSAGKKLAEKVISELERKKPLSENSDKKE